MAKKHDKIELKTLLIRKVQATHICIDDITKKHLQINNSKHFNFDTFITNWEYNCILLFLHTKWLCINKLLYIDTQLYFQFVKLMLRIF